MNLDAIKLLIFDLDGTLYVDNQVITGAAETIQQLRHKGFLLRFMTNTTTKSHHQIVAQLNHFGFDVHPDELLSAPQAAKNYLTQQQQLLARNLRLWPVVSEAILADFTEFEFDMTRPDYVLLGDIGESWSLALINKLFKVVANGAQLIALHQNKFWQRRDGLHVDIGFFVAGLEFVTARPAMIMGKPSSRFFEQVLHSAKCSASETLLVGDDIDTDIGGAQAVGMAAALVKTGKYRAEYAAQSSIQPDWLLDDVNQLYALLESHHLA